MASTGLDHRSDVAGPAPFNPTRLSLRRLGMRPLSTMSLLSAALLALAACGGGDAASSPSSSPSTVTSTSGNESNTVAEATTNATTDAGEPAVVTISDSRFDTTELRVPVGTTVRFVNTDPYAHTVTSKDDSPAAFASGEFGQDETFEFTFDEPGEYAYFCEIHPTMRASVIVDG